jgi:UDP-N-acetylglucosamine 3-dehydrogenase
MTLRAAVIGLGMMGRHHVRVLSRMPGVELVAAMDRAGDPYGAAEFAAVPVLSELEPLLALGIDLCVVAVPTDQHLELGVALAAAGVHTLIEKPLAASLAEGRQLIAAFEQAGVVGCVGHIERFNPALMHLRRRLHEGQLGTLYQVATRRQGPYPDRIRDIGVVKDLATHDLDLTSWITGSAYSSVAAQTAYVSGGEFEDLVSVTARLENGAVASHLVNWLSPTKDRKVVVTGELGCLEADMLTADLTFWRNGDLESEWEALSMFRGMREGDMVRYAIPKPEPLAVELEGFRDAVLGVGDGVVSLAEAMAPLVVAEAVLRASQDGRTVLLSEIV